MLPIRSIKPKTARTKRYLDNKGPQIVENPRTTLFLRYTTCSQIVQLVTQDLLTLKKPLCIRFDKKNTVHPFEDASSFEFFADKNDASMLVYGSHSKKRPHAVTIARMFDFKVLDMLELLVDPDTLRTLSQFKGSKVASGLKPLLAFSGSAFESPVPNAYTMAKSLFVDLFKGADAQAVDVEGLQYIMNFSVDEEESSEVKPKIHMRCYLLSTKKVPNSSLPKVEVEEMGPRIDFRVGRVHEADPAMLKEAMRRPKMLEPKTKKNIETDLMGDKVGRIHMGKQDLNQLQTRKMKGLKRSRDVVDEDFDDDDVAMGGAAGDESDGGGVAVEKKAKIDA